MSRDKQINFRVSEAEIRRFDTLASHYGVSVSAMIRMLVTEKHEALSAIQDAGLGPEHDDLLDVFSEPRLEELQELGFLHRVPGGYALTAKGRVYLRSRWESDRKR